MFVLGMEVSYSLAPKVLPRVHAAVLRECNRRTMLVHARENIPRHFDADASRRYGYGDRRSTINLAWLYRSDPATWTRVPKIQRKGFNRETGEWALGKLQNRAYYDNVKSTLGLGPLQWSGLLKKTALNPINRTIRATQNRSTLRIRTPVYATSRIRQMDGQPMTQMQKESLRRSAELQAITQGELRGLRASFKREYLAIMRDPANPKHTFLAGQATILRERKRFGKGT